MAAKVKHRGAWPGNDTIWRMVVDLYKAMLKKERRYLSVIYGIIAGEGQGPFCPTSKTANIILVGDDLLATDIAAVRYMGFDPQRIKYLNYFIENGFISYGDIDVSGSGIGSKYFEADNNYADFYVVKQWECIKNRM